MLQHNMENLELKLAEQTVALQKANRQLRMSEERFRSLMEQSPLAIEILTPEGQILQVNTSWMRLWGLNEKETALVLSKYNMLNDNQVIEQGLLPLVEKAFSGDAVALPAFEYDGNRAADEMDLKHLRPNSHWIECHLYAVKNRDEGITHVVNIHMDITAKKRSEIQLEQNFENMIGQSESLKYVLHRVEQVAPTDSPVLVMGETGTGKERMARALHRLSRHGKGAAETLLDYNNKSDAFRLGFPILR